MRAILRAFLILSLSFAVIYGEYQIFVKGPEYAKPHSGTVLSSYESKGRGSCWFSVVDFDNGDVQEVNTGHTEYRAGSRFTGKLSWNPLLGVSGTAYSWNPGDWLIFVSIPAIVFNVMLFVGGITAIFVFAFGKQGKKEEA